MLSIKAIKPGQGTDYYFEKDNNYYFKEDQEHLISAFEWGGKGATALNLRGQVMAEDFGRIMKGILPTGQQLGLKKGDEIRHRPGFDLTFSAPKSVSILALVGGDNRLLALHQKSVVAAMNVVERLAQARVTRGGELTYESTRNLTFAKFIHDTSREGDPQLHTHTVVANVTQLLDGTWRSLASDMSRKNGFFEKVMNDRNYFGMIYRAELAKGLTELGFELKMDGQDGLFEIQGIPEDVLKLFSKRREQIEEAIKAWGRESVKAYDLAALNTRKAKTPIERDVLKEKWVSELAGTGWDIKTFIASVSEKMAQSTEKLTIKPSDRAYEIIHDTVVILSQHSLAMDYNLIMKKATEYGIGCCTHTDLVKAFDEAATQKHFIPLDEVGQRWTTAKLIQTEISLLDSVEKGKKGKTTFLLSEEKLNQRNIDAPTQKWLSTLLETNHRITVLNHNAQNKHETFTQLLHVIEDHGKTVQILSPNANHANEMHEKVEREPVSSLWGWLKNFGKESIGDTVAGFNFKMNKDLALPLFVTRLKNGVIIVDGAQKITPQAMADLFDVTEKLKARVILLNEAEGIHMPIQSDVMTTLTKANVYTVTRDVKKESACVTIQLYTVKEDTPRLDALARHYAKLPEVERKQTAVIAQNQREAKQLNEAIRTQLKNAGQLSHQEKSILTYQPVFLSKPERKYALHYEVGMVLRQHNGISTEELKVHAVMKEENALWVMNEGGQKQRLHCRHISENVQIFQEKKLILAEKESLIMTGNMKQLNLKKGEALTIQSLSEQEIVLEKEGNLINLGPDDWNKISVDYHYAQSITQLRTEKMESVITSMRSRAINQATINLLNQKTEKNIIFYTDDPEKAESRFTANLEKITVIDKVLRAYDESKNITRELTPQAVDTIKKELKEALSHLTQESIKTPIEKAVDYAIAKLSERNAGFEHETLVKTALNHALGNVTHEEIEKILKEKIESGFLRHGRDSEGKSIWTTQEAVDLEHHILATIERGRGTQMPLMDKTTLSKLLETSTLNTGQREACYLIGTTHDRFVMVQGYAGTGKSTMLAELMSIFKAQAMQAEKPLEILGCAPTHQAVKELQALGLQAQTLKSLLIENSRSPKDFSNTLVLLDEGSMVSNRDFDDFQNMIEKNNGRAVFVQDIAQLLSVESGKPAEIALKKGNISVAYMTEIVRQEDATIKKAVTEVIQREVKSAFNTLEQMNPDTIDRDINAISSPWLEHFVTLTESIVEIPSLSNENNKSSAEKVQKDPIYLKGQKNPLTLQEAVAKEYLSRTKAVRDDTVIIVHTHADRAIVHQELLKGLRAYGEVKKETIDFPRLVTKGLTRVETRNAGSYKTNEYIKIGQNNYMKVVSVDKKARCIECEHDDGRKEILYPERLSKRLPVEVYQKEKASLSSGMRIKFTKTDKERDILANREWHVMGISEGKINLIEKGSDKSFDMNPNDLKDCHWDYAYTVTGYGAQGSSCKYVIDHAASYLKNLTSQRSFYISVSRARQHIMVFTDDKAALLEKLTHNFGNKYAALEVTRELNTYTKSVSSSITMLKKEKLKGPEKVVRWQEKQGWKEEKKPFIDAKILEEKLKNNVELVATHLLGDSNKSLSSGRQWRYGTKGSLLINIDGEKKGKWHNFEAAQSGNMINLIQEQLGLGFREALMYGASLLGEDLKTVTSPRKKEPIQQTNADKTYAKKIHETIQKLIKTSLPIQGTVGEKYLKETRGITYIPTDNVRFLSRVYTGKGNSEMQKYAPALLSMARDQKGQVQSVQVTYLNSKTYDKAGLNIPKRTYGNLKNEGAFVELQKVKKEEKTYITEGIETGLSVANARPNAHVIAILSKSNFSNIHTKNLTKNVVFCLDNDGEKTLSSNLIKAMERLYSQGRQVSLVMPEKVKTDMNDLLKLEGISAVKNVLNKEISFENLNKIMDKKILQITNSAVSISVKEYGLMQEKSAINSEKTAISNLFYQSKISENHALEKTLLAQVSQELYQNQSVKLVGENNSKHFIKDRELEIL